MDGSMNWMKPANPLSKILLNLRGGLFCESTFTSKFLIIFLNVHTKEKQYLSLMNIIYGNTSNNTAWILQHLRILISKPKAIDFQFCQIESIYVVVKISLGVRRCLV